jgi:predicted lipid carrier protein YhbT
MRVLQISLRQPAADVYHGLAATSTAKKGITLLIWAFLVEVQHCQVALSVKAGQRVVLDGGCFILVMGRPGANDPDAAYDLYLSHIIWPDEVN